MPQATLIVTSRAGVPLGELARATLDNVSWELNAAGSMTFTMQQDDPRVTLPKLLLTEVQVWIDGTLMWWGIPWRCKSTDRTAQFECEGLLSYFTKRFILNASKDYDNVEQYDIAKDLVLSSQSGTDQNLNIAVASQTPSGTKRYRRYQREEHAMILDLLVDFSTLTRAVDGVHDGFDIDIDISSGSKVFTCYSPYKGTTRPELVLEYGRNLTEFDVEEDAIGVANRAYCTGGSNGEVKFEDNYRDTASCAAIGEWQHVFAFGDEPDVTVLKDRARDYVSKHTTPSVNPSLTAAQVPVTLLDKVKVGDTLPVRIQKGRIDVNQNRRIRRIEWSPKTNTVKFDFMDVI